MAQKRKREAGAAGGAVPGVGGDDGILQFRKAVQDLKKMSLSKITALTALADGQYGDAKAVSQILVDEITTAKMERLQPLVSVVDSILKKVGKDYKNHLSGIIPDAIRVAYSKSNEQMHGWLRKMISESWRKHDLLPADVLDRLDLVFMGDSPPPVGLAAPAAPAVTMAGLAPQTPLPAQPLPAVPAQPGLPQPQAFAQPLADAVAAAPTAAAAPEATPRVPEALLRAGPAPPMKAPPAQRPAVAAPPQAEHPGVAAQVAAPAVQLPDTAELVERRLSILSKIIERRSPGHDELREIMEVPEVRKAITMQQKGQRQKAMALLSEFKQTLERKHREAQGAKLAAALSGQSQGDAPVAPDTAQAAKPRDPRQEALAFKPIDPRQLSTAAQEPKLVDPRQQDSRPVEQRPSDPRHAARPVDPRRPDTAAAALGQHVPAADQAPELGAPGKRAAEAEAAEQQAKQQRTASAADVKEAAAAAPAAPADPAAAGAPAAPAEAPPVDVASDDEAQQVNGNEIVPARQVLQGLPSLGFSEAWLRQFMEQMPTKPPTQEQKLEAPAIGRKVLGASGEQMVYVDELNHSEMLLLMQLIFMLEDRLRRTGGGIDLTQRIPHTFSYLQVEPAIDVMLKRFFGDLPHQCQTSGLRFATQEKLRKHHEVTQRRRHQQQQRQRGAEARGWMESIPEWVGNRDLVVGPALFRMGEASDEKQQAQDAQAKVQAGGGPEDEEDAEAGSARWNCPFDERRSVCPISGEALPRIWSTALNDWAYNDTVAVEMGASRPLRFPPGGPIGPQGLSETAVLFKRSCFYNTPAAKQLEALQECCRGGNAGGPAVGGWRGRDGVGAEPLGHRLGKAPNKQPYTLAPRKDPDLAALAASRPPSRRFF